MGLDTSSFMGDLTSNAVPGVAYDVCELYMFAAYILATNFIGDPTKPCPVDFDMDSESAKKIAMEKLREMLVGVFQEMIEKVMHIFDASALNGVMSLDELQKATNYDNKVFRETVATAFLQPDVVGENTMPLYSLSNLDAIGSKNQSYMEEELSDYAFVLDANLYQIIKPVK